MNSVLRELLEPSSLFIGSATLLTELTEWYEEGRTKRLVVKRDNPEDIPIQAEVKWIGTVSHDSFWLSVDGGWRIWENNSYKRPFEKAKASCILSRPTMPDADDFWMATIKGAKKIMQTSISGNIGNLLIVNNTLKVRHSCFQVCSF